MIIDLQNKNSEMTQRLAAMENGGLLNGGDNSFDIGCVRVGHKKGQGEGASVWVPMEAPIYTIYNFKT